ncbi:MAG: pentapeptide repeat-containing protein [Kiloniellaceae bacterium]
MTNLSQTGTRDRPPQKVLIGTRITAAQLRALLDAHTRFQAGRADGRRAVLLRCDLSGLDMRGVDLSGADLVECDLEGANLTGALLEGATLTGSCFTDSLLNAARFTGADLTRTDFHMADLRGTDFSQARLTDAHLEGALFGDSPETGLPTTIDTRVLDRVMARRRRH